MKLEITHSPDDHGYYGEVWDEKTGQTIYTTPVLKSEQSVERNAKAWAAKKENCEGAKNGTS